jgi:hypothetical protein
MNGGLDIDSPLMRKNVGGHTVGELSEEAVGEALGQMSPFSCSPGLVEWATKADPLAPHKLYCMGLKLGMDGARPRALDNTMISFVTSSCKKYFAEGANVLTQVRIGNNGTIDWQRYGIFIRFNNSELRCKYTGAFRVLLSAPTCDAVIRNNWSYDHAELTWTSSDGGTTTIGLKGLFERPQAR